MEFVKRRFPKQLLNKRMLILFLIIALIFSLWLARPASAAIAFRAASTANNGAGSTSLTISPPVGVQAGDVMIAIVGYRNNGVISTPSGWTAINSAAHLTVNIDSIVFYRVATASESNVTFTLPVSDKAAAAIVAYSGVDTTSPVDVDASTATGPATTYSTSSVTTNHTNEMLVALYGAAVGGTFTAGSGMTIQAQATSSGGGSGSTKVTVAAQDVLQAAAGSTGAKSITAPSNAAGTTHIVALKPKAEIALSGFRFFENNNIASMTSVSHISDPTYGTSSRSVTYTGDGGHVVANAHLVKYSSAGTVSWAKYRGASLGGDAVIETNDSGLVVAGSVGAYGAQAGDAGLSKYDSSGTLLWSRMWGGANIDDAKDVIETSDGGLLMTGYTLSFGSGDYDAILVKYDSSGNLVWDTVTGGTGSDMAFAVTELAGGGYLVVGDSTSFTPSDVRDMLLIKYDSSGNMIWSKTWPGAGEEFATDVVATHDGGFVVTGYTTSYFGGFGLNDGIVAKFDSDGTKEWGKTWGSSSGDKGVEVVQSMDGGYVIAANIGNMSNVSLIKYSPDGTRAWTYSWAAGPGDIVHGLAAANDGGFVSVGNNSSSQGLYVRYDASGRIPGCSASACQAQTPSELTRAAVASSKSPTSSSPSATTSSFTPTITSFTPTLNTSISVSSPTGAPLAAQDASAAAKGVGVPFRIRINHHVSYSAALVGTAMKLQVAERSGTCDTNFTGETYSDVTAASGKLRFYDNSALADAASISTDGADPTHGTDSIIYQSYEEANNFAFGTATSIGQDGLWDFSLVFHASATVGSYCLRTVNSDSSNITSYTVIPEISLSAPTVGQANYRFFANADSVTPGSPLALQDTAATVAAETPFRLRQRLAVGAAQLSQYGANYKLQYAEKSGVCDTGFSGETYANAAVPGTPSSLSNYAGTAVNDTGVGTRSWTFTNSAISAPNSTGAQSVSSANGTYTTNWLKLTNYGFSIPAGVTINGIEVKITARSDAVTTLPVIDAVRLVKAGAIQAYEDGTNQPLSTLYSLVSYGSASSKWSDTWTAADINDSGFGVVISGVFSDTGLGGAVDVDSVQIVVSYTVEAAPGPVAYGGNSTPADFASISSNPNDPTNGARPAVYQSYRETDPFNNNVAAIPSGSDGLWDFALTSTAAADGKTYCLRVVKSDGSPLDSYSQIPEITFSAGGGGGVTTEQKLRGGQSVQGGVKSPFEL